PRRFDRPVDGHDDRRSHQGLRARRGLASELVHRAVRPAVVEWHAGRIAGRFHGAVRSGPDLDRITTTTEADDSSYLGRLAARSAAKGTVLCLGLDPDPEALPEGFSRDLRGVESFARLVLDVAGPSAA